MFIRGYNNPKTSVIRGVYPTLRALKTLVYPEKFHNPKLWNSDMFCARVYMILENCVDHPLFEDFVHFIARSNRHLIPFARKGKAELDKITRETKLLPAFNPTYNQEKRDTSLKNFESIRIASLL
nr:MAG: RNA-dependent RNA polymerase [Mystacina tuberculata picobirnavirus 6]